MRLLRPTDRRAQPAEIAMLYASDKTHGKSVGKGFSFVREGSANCPLLCGADAAHGKVIAPRSCLGIAHALVESPFVIKA